MRPKERLDRSGGHRCHKNLNRDWKIGLRTGRQCTDSKWSALSVFKGEMHENKEVLSSAIVYACSQS